MPPAESRAHSASVNASTAEAPALAPPPPGSNAAIATRASQTDAETARTAGRGGLAIAVAKVSFICFGFAQQLILPRLVGVDGYGEVSRVLAIVGIVNNVVVGSAIQGVSHAVSSVAPEHAGEAFRRTLAIHVVIAAVVSTTFALAAGAIASAIGAPHVATPLRLVAAVVLMYGLYAPLIGSLNGRRRFFDQAGLDIFYGAMRTVGIAGGAFLLARGGAGVIGAIGGFVAASALIVPIALTRSGLGRRGPAGPSARQYLEFLGPLVLSQVFLNLLLQTDFMLFSRFVGEAASARGLGNEAADKLVGVYRGVQLFGFLPYQLLMSITFILFPMLARAHAERDADAVARYTSTGVRLALIITGLMCGTIAALGPHVLRFAFPLEIAQNGGDALRILSLGLGAFAILGITSAALTSLKHEVTAAGLTLATVILVAVGCTIAIPRAPFGSPMVVTTAAAASCALAVAAIAGGVLLKRVAGAFVAPKSVARVAIAVAITIAIGTRVPWLGKIAVLGEAAAMAVVYLATLWILRELGRDDLATIRAGLRGRRSG